MWDTEVAFARTMVQRDLAAFERFLSPHTMWWSGPQGSVLRGKAAVVAAWRRFYEGAQAPFSWAPDEVVVIGDGTLATSTGPVRTRRQVVARFRSVWRREPNGSWLIVLDRGEPADAPKPRDLDRARRASGRISSICTSPSARSAKPPSQ